MLVPDSITASQTYILGNIILASLSQRLRAAKLRQVGAGKP